MESVSAHNIVSLKDTDFQKSVRSDFGLDITNVEKITKGFSNQVYKATHEGKIIYIRINEKPTIFPVEIAAYTLFEKKGIPVPKIIAYQEHPKNIGFPTMIMHEAEGEALNHTQSTPEQQDSIYEQMGDMLRRIHEIKVPGFGYLDVEHEILKGRFSTWKEFVVFEDNRFCENKEILRSNNLLTEEELQKVGEIYREVADIDFGQASLIHRDINSAHVFVKENTISGIIDLGGLQAGDPRYDIATSLIFQNSRQQEVFIKGYGELAHDPLIYKYVLMLAAKKAVFRMSGGRREAVEEAVKVFREFSRKI